MPLYEEAAIEAAIEEVLGGQSLRKAAIMHGVLRQTLADRILGRQTASQAQETRQRLSPAIEQQLAKLILVQEALGYAPTHVRVKAIATKLLAAQGDTNPLGKRWISGFFSRNPMVKTKLGVRIDAKRIDGANPQAINEFFDRLEPVSHIPPEYIYNVDKAGIMEGQGVNGLVVGSSEVRPKKVYVKSSGSRVWTTLIECISATGKALTPSIIFKGTNVQKQWFEESFNEPWYFTCSENGWTTNLIGLEWLERVFIPQTQPADPSQMRLLVVDGHGSHATDDFMWECFQNNIYLLFLPPKTSHVLQPLDLAIFSVLKRAYRKHVGYLDSLSDSAPVGKLNFLRCYAMARHEAMTRKNILSGFRASGIWPRNRQKALRSDQVVTQARPATPPPPPAQATTFETPKRGGDILALARNPSPGTRLAFRKVAKKFDSMVGQLTLQAQRIEAVEDQIQRMQPQKRQKVVRNPNERFVIMDKIMKQKEVDEEGWEEEEEEEEEEEAEEEVQLRRSLRVRVPTKRRLEQDK